MTSTLTKHDHSIQQTEIAVVQGGFGKDFMVLYSQGCVRAKLAFSCLVTPEPGDKVLVSTGNDLYILAIIERPNNEDMKLQFPADVSLVAKHGKINLSGREGIDITSPSQTNLTTNKLAINSLNTSIISNELSVRGDKVVSQWREVNSISKAFNFITDCLTQRMKNSFKTVDGVDQQTSLNFMQTIKKTLSIRSRDALITARKDVKIDGERIHMG